MKKLRDKYFQTNNQNESLHEIINDNGVRVVKFATSKKSVKSTMFPYHGIHKYTWTSAGKTQPD
jgi:hypothetical protein